MKDKLPSNKGKVVALPPTRLTLTKLHHVKTELARLYREARRGDIDPSDATKFTFILQAIARLITDSELEARIEKLEQETLHEKARR